MRLPQLTIFAILVATAFMGGMLAIGHTISPHVSPETWHAWANSALLNWTGLNLAVLLTPILLVAYGLGFLHARRRYRSG